MLGLVGALSYQATQASVPLALLAGGATMLGVLAAFVHQAFQRETVVLALSVAATVGTLTNTVVVLSAIGLLSQVGASPASCALECTDGRGGCQRRSRDRRPAHHDFGLTDAETDRHGTG